MRNQIAARLHTVTARDEMEARMHYEEAMGCGVLYTVHTVNSPGERAQRRVGVPVQWSPCMHGSAMPLTLWDWRSP
jgi:hypothetical protein